MVCLMRLKDQLPACHTASARERSMKRWMNRFVTIAEQVRLEPQSPQVSRMRWWACAMLAMALAFVSGPARQLAAADLTDLAAEARAEKGEFRTVDAGVLKRAAAGLRVALAPLGRLLDRSASGLGWRRYLDWPTLSQVSSDEFADADAGVDASLLDRLQMRFETGANGIAMPQFARVRRALDRYRRAADAATAADAAERHAEILERLAVALEEAEADGTSDALEPVGLVLHELEATGQSLELVERVRAVTGRPNLLIDVEESLLAAGVDREVDQVEPVDEVIVGTRVRGTGHTIGQVRLDLVPSTAEAAFELVFGAVNHSQTRGGRGPVMVFSNGETQLDARKRLLVDDEGITVGPTQVSATARSTPTGIAVSKRFGERLIRKIASRKSAEIRPQADREASAKAEAKLRRQFEQQTAGPIKQARADYQQRFREPLLERDWYPDLLTMSTSDSRLSVAARKAISDKISAASPAPAPAAEAVLSARVHDTLVNNVAEITLSGRTLTQEDVEKLATSRDVALPEAFGSDPDQQPWSITFARRRPVELDVADDWLQLTIRGDGFTSGDRSFPGMDIWVAYRVWQVEGDSSRLALIREGDVNIFPPGFESGVDRLTVQETSLKGILTKRFNRIFKETVEIEPLELPGQLEAAGPLPIEQLLVLKDGWISAGWRAKDAERPAEADVAAGGVAAAEVELVAAE